MKVTWAEQSRSPSLGGWMPQHETEVADVDEDGLRQWADEEFFGVSSITVDFRDGQQIGLTIEADGRKHVISMTLA